MNDENEQVTNKCRRDGDQMCSVISCCSNNMFPEPNMILSVCVCLDYKIYSKWGSHELHNMSLWLINKNINFVLQPGFCQTKQITSISVLKHLPAKTLKSEIW